MKKILLFIMLVVALCVIGASAQTFKVEKALKAKANGTAITAGQTLNEKTTIEIGDGGYLMFVDNKSHKRYYIDSKCNKQIKAILKQNKKKPIKVTMGDVAPMISHLEGKDRYSSTGSVVREVPEGHNVTPVIVPAEVQFNQDKPAEQDSTTVIILVP